MEKALLRRTVLVLALTVAGCSSAVTGGPPASQQPVGSQTGGGTIIDGYRLGDPGACTSSDDPTCEEALRVNDVIT